MTIILLTRPSAIRRDLGQVSSPSAIVQSDWLLPSAFLASFGDSLVPQLAILMPTENSGCLLDFRETDSGDDQHHR
jgi:hypothetical protein